MKVVAYKLLQHEWPERLMNAVNKAIEQGWQPLGGVCVDGDLVMQAMVLYDN